MSDEQEILREMKMARYRERWPSEKRRRRILANRSKMRVLRVLALAERVIWEVRR